MRSEGASDCEIEDFVPRQPKSLEKEILNGLHSSLDNMGQDRAFPGSYCEKINGPLSINEIHN
jgi:hypothetical protein